MKLLKQTIKWGFFIIITLILTVFLIDREVVISTKKQVYSNISSLPNNKVGLLLGTGKYVKNEYVNLYYQYRIDAAIALYKAGKIEYILVSGDNSKRYYDEPTTIKNDLIKGGIPANRIILDYAGFRTLDSVVRSKKVFGQSEITIISQEFHNQRALYIANKNNMKAIAFNAKDVSRHYGFRTRMREKLARVKMVLDLLFNVSPKFLGEKIAIEAAGSQL